MKEKILDKHYKPKMHWKSVNRENVLKAMEEYSEFKVEELKKAIRLAKEIHNLR